MKTQLRSRICLAAVLAIALANGSSLMADCNIQFDHSTECVLYHNNQYPTPPGCVELDISGPTYNFYYTSGNKATLTQDYYTVWCHMVAIQWVYDAATGQCSTTTAITRYDWWETCTTYNSSSCVHP